MRALRDILLSMAVAATSFATAKADTLTNTGNFDFFQSSAPGGGGEIGIDKFPEFNTDLGTLTGLSFAFEGAVYTTLSTMNPGLPASYGVQGTLGFVLDPRVCCSGPNIALPTQSVLIPAGTATEQLSFANVNVNVNLDPSYFPDFEYTAFESYGYPYIDAGIDFSLINQATDIGLLYSATYPGEFTETFTYTEFVAEPLSFGIFMVAIAGGLAARYRRDKGALS